MDPNFKHCRKAESKCDILFILTTSKTKSIHFIMSFFANILLWVNFVSIHIEETWVL